MIQYSNHVYDDFYIVCLFVFVRYRPSVDNDGKGCLCWCRRGSGLDFSPSRCLPLNKTVQICMGKQTKAFKNVCASEGNPACCFSIMVDKMILNLEVSSPELRASWLNSFHTTMTAAGKQRVFDDHIETTNQSKQQQKPTDKQTNITNETN
jgi:hypothetical protein